MTEKGRRDFCIECRRETGYLLRKKSIVKNIRGKNYTFGITVAVCAECGEEISVPGLIDKNVQEIDEQYRAAEGLVSNDDIEKLTGIPVRTLEDWEAGRRTPPEYIPRLIEYQMKYEKLFSELSKECK